VADGDAAFQFTPGDRRRTIAKPCRESTIDSFFTRARTMASNLLTRAFDLATAPARFAVRQTVTNLEILGELRRDFRDYEPILQRAAEQTLQNMIAVLVAAERSLPADIEALTPNEREAQIADSLARGERHLLAAVGELYRSYRLITAEQGIVIDNPDQEELERH
jgi:hypothetical protein